LSGFLPNQKTVFSGDISSGFSESFPPQIFYGNRPFIFLEICPSIFPEESFPEFTNFGTGFCLFSIAPAMSNACVATQLFSL
jgi:hypothetical protein